MADSKDLKIGFQLDDQQFQRVFQALQKLTAEAERFQTAMQGRPYSAGAARSGGGGKDTPGSTPSAAGNNKSPTALLGVPQPDAILRSLEALKKYSREGPQALKQVQDALKQAHDVQARGLEKLQDEYASLTTERERALGSNALKEADEYASRMAGVVAKIAEATGEVKKLKGAVGDVSGGKPGKTGLMSALTQSIGQGAMNSPKDLLGSLLGNGAGAVLARSAGMAAAGGYTALKTNQAWNNFGLDQSAARGNLTNPMVQKLRSGDIEDVLAMKYMQKAGTGAGDHMFTREEILKRSFGTDNEILGMAEGAVKMASDFVGGGAIGGSLTKEARETARLAKFMDSVEKTKQTQGFRDTMGRANQYMNDTAASRGSLAPLVGAGFYKQKGADGKELKDAFGNPILKDTYTDFVTNAAKSGMYGEEVAHGIAQARSMGGAQFARRHGGRIASANLGGYAGVGEAMAGAERRGSLQAGLSAFGGKIDKTAGIHLANSVMGSGWDAYGTTNREGVMAAIQSGFGKNSLVGGFTGGINDFNVVQNIQAGLQAGNALSKGFDPYQQGRNTLSAINAMPGGTSYGQDSLASMNFETLLDVSRGGSNATSRSYGIGKSEARNQLGQIGSSALDTWTDENGKDQMSMAMRRWRKAQDSGMDLPEYLASLKKRKGGRADAESLGVMIGERTGMGEQAGLGFIGMQSGIEGLGDKLQAGKTPGGSRDDVTKAQMEVVAKAAKASSEELAKIFGGVLDSFKIAPAVEKDIASLGRFEVALDALATKMFKMAGVDTKTESSLLEAYKTSVSEGARTVAPMATRAYDAAKNLLK